MNKHEPEGITGKLLISSPVTENDVFRRSVILMLGHDTQGAIGVIINRLTTSIDLQDLCKEMDVPVTPHIPKHKIHFGGPVSMNTGIVLHSSSYNHKTSIPITNYCNVTSCFDVLQDLEKGLGPEKSRFILGYAGWDAGQLEEELRENEWIVCDPTEELIFDQTTEGLWGSALKQSGFERFAYSPVSGTA